MQRFTFDSITYCSNLPFSDCFLSGKEILTLIDKLSKFLDIDSTFFPGRHSIHYSDKYYANPQKSKINYLNSEKDLILNQFESLAVIHVRSDAFKEEIINSNDFTKIHPYLCALYNILNNKRQEFNKNIPTDPNSHTFIQDLKLFLENTCGFNFNSDSEFPINTLLDYDSINPEIQALATSYAKNKDDFTKIQLTEEEINTAEFEAQEYRKILEEVSFKIEERHEEEYLDRLVKEKLVLIIEEKNQDYLNKQVLKNYAKLKEAIKKIFFGVRF